jgi:hypothetical protein
LWEQPELLLQGSTEKCHCNQKNCNFLGDEEKGRGAVERELKQGLELPDLLSFSHCQPGST